MQRCNEGVANYTVTMLHNGEEERRQELHVHPPVYKSMTIRGEEVFDYDTVLEPLPIFSSATPFTGELCEHEVAALKNSFKEISPELFFTLQEV